MHRDLKPSNIMVLERGGRLFPKLLDFGIAKVNHEIEQHRQGSSLAETPELLDASGVDALAVQRTRSDLEAHVYRLTRSDAGIGSRPYMSPEQWSDASTVGPATDIYSLGVVAYEVLTGRVPFAGSTTGEYYRQHRDADVPSLGDEFSADLDRAVRRALAKDPEHRQRSALELASELRAALQAQPREQLRFSAQQWEDRARSPGLLWRSDMLADVERWTHRSPSGALSQLECSFVAASQRRARRARWLRRALVVVVAAGVFGLLQYRAVVKTEMAVRIATESEVEQGRQALLHGETSEAVRHLERAYQRGDRSSGVAFMLARALEPRMAELGRLTSSTGRMWSAMFAPDGKRILTTDDKSARMWDAASSQLLFTMSHGDTVYQPLEQVALLLGDIDGWECSFAPYGVAITKKQGRKRGANPVWYLDITPGHKWLTVPLNKLVAEAVKEGKFKDSHIARLTPFIEQMGTGNRVADGGEYRKEFWWERDWRHVGDFALPTHVIVLCPDDERAEIAKVVDEDSIDARIDPRWNLEQIIARLAGFDANDGPM